MSRPHHALVVAGAPAPRAEDYRAVITAAELIVAVDSGVELCRAIGRWPDHLVGDMDSVTPETLREAERAAVAVHALDSKKDFSDLDAALDLCQSLMVDRPVSLTAVSHGRADHFLAVCGSLARYSRLCPVIEEPDMAAWILDSRGCTTLSISPAKGQFSVLALLDPATISIEGARYPLSRVEIGALSSRGLSNVIAEECATVTVHGGTVIVISPLDSHTPRVVQQDARYARASG